MRSVAWGSDFYPRPPRGGRRAVQVDVHSCADISIHALREEGDEDVPEQAVQMTVISIHALREEGDKSCKNNLSKARLFLSTPSARRATQCVDWLHL